MSRELSSTERRMCRVVFALLGAMLFAFLLLNTINSLSNSSPPVNKSPTGSTNASSHPKQAIQSSLAPQPARSEREPAPAQGIPHYSAPVPLPVIKARSELPQKTTLETAVRFDPQRLERRPDGSGLAATRGLLRLSSAEVPARIPSRESFALPQGGPIVTPMFSTVEAPSAPPSESTQGEPSSERVQLIQARLRDLGFLSSPASGAWDASSRAALRDFKVVNHLANDDVWDLQTSERLTSESAIRADQSFIGNWSKAPCQSARKDNLRLTINSRRVRSSAGGVCEFRDFVADHSGWRVRTTCSHGNQRWKADGKFAVQGDKLIWTSEGDANSYFRCN